ncbi:DNA glycosylase/AP lyase ROS1-like [Rhododendron vialii]|uniref:DNA glycosylase/AP lyase ROS1-like n=1 Tax=Rhododendron vialii TaxID=182163 RepID=UPI00265EB3A2|nr:DNA glycosylase/AP lyase ROS1-like [Rhododendron vialii]
MNNKLAQWNKKCLDRIAGERKGIDLEWLRTAESDKAKNYLMSIQGLGLKSVEFERLLTLRHLAFPVRPYHLYNVKPQCSSQVLSTCPDLFLEKVDTNVVRIVVRLGWVPIELLPEGIQMHLLKKEGPFTN